MKKLFTLLVGALFASNAFGQELVTNGNCEGTMPADHYTFWVQDTRIDGVEEEPGEDPYQHAITHSSGEKGWLGHAEIVDNPFKAGDHCVKVHVASKAESEALGTARLDANGNYVAWNTQFFIYMDQPVPEGKWLTLTMKVRTDIDGEMSGQAHQTPGAYTYYSLFTDNTITYEKNKWNKIWRKAQVSSSHITGEGHSFFQAVCFNLSIASAEESFDLYFDDMSVVMSDEEPQEPTVEDNSDWINFMRKGVDSRDAISDIDRPDKSGQKRKAFECLNFMIQAPNEEGVQTLQPAEVVDLEDGTRAVVVHTKDFYTETKEEDDLDADGNQQFDPETGEVLKKSVTTYYWSDGSEIGTSAPARWSAQFFVSTLHTMKSGERFKFRFKAKADKPANIGNQGHYGPSQYLGWEPLGGSSNIALTTDWKEFEFGDTPNAIDKSKNNGKVPGSLDGCHTITFDCYDLQEENNYYFIFEECSFTEQNVTIADRTLGEENVNLIVNSDPEAEQANPIDGTGLLTAFEEADFSFMNNTEKNGVKLITWTKPEDPDEEAKETYSGLRAWTDGGFIAKDGYFVDDDFDQGIMIRFDEESIDGKTVNINIWNTPESGVAFADGETVKTDFCVSSSGWYYIYHSTLGNAATIAELNGIKAVKKDKAGNGLIYNLSGQRVDSSYKGLVIKNGQKAIQK